MYAIRSYYEKHKFGCYQSELPLMEQITQKLGMPQLEPQRWARHPLVYLMEAADDICYALIDLEDGLEMELLDYDFHLFTEKGSGVVGVLYRSEPAGYRLALVAPAVADEMRNNFV